MNTMRRRSLIRGPVDVVTAGASTRPYTANNRARTAAIIVVPQATDPTPASAGSVFKLVNLNGVADARASGAGREFAHVSTRNCEVTVRLVQ